MLALNPPAGINASHIASLNVCGEDYDQGIENDRYGLEWLVTDLTLSAKSFSSMILLCGP
jgi:hypothetical protein